MKEYLSVWGKSRCPRCFHYLNIVAAGQIIVPSEAETEAKIAACAEEIWAFFDFDPDDIRQGHVMRIMRQYFGAAEEEKEGYE